MRQNSLLLGGLALKNEEYIKLWATLPADSQVEEVIRNFFIRQPGLWVTGKSKKVKYRADVRQVPFNLPDTDETQGECVLQFVVKMSSNAVEGNPSTN